MASTGRVSLPLLLTVTAVLVPTVVLADWGQQQQHLPNREHACYHNIPSPFFQFGSKTTYGAVAGKDLLTPTDCRPMQVWLLSRHGTRYPSQKTIEKLKKLNELKTIITDQSKLCREDITNIKNWNLNLTSNDHYMLHRQGVEELKSLATRLKRQFPQIFNTQYSDSKFKFLTSHKQRAKDSAIAFYQSMFNQNPEKELPIVDHSDDRFYLYKCKHGQVDDDDSTVGQGEVKKFEESRYMQSVVSRVSMVMGLKQNLSYENVSLMYESCKYDKAWYIQSRPAWCAVFTQEDIEVYEYLEDLKLYYEHGYGNPIAERMGCPIVKDMINNFKNLSRDKTGPLGIFYFGHSLNILTTVTRLGVGKDTTPLLSTNFETMKNRKWRTTNIDPFASNVIAVFYRCKDGNKAMILLNEHAIPMNKDQCKLCPWEPIEAQFDGIISNNQTCNLDMCKNSAALPSISLFTIILVMIQYTKYL